MNIWAYQRDTGASFRSCQWLELKQFDQQNKVVLDSKSKCKINIYDSY